MSNHLAIGVDVGGTGTKGALVDCASGELISERIKYPTPEGATPGDVFDVIWQIVDDIGAHAAGLPLGVCVPAVVKDGHTRSAANISDEWVDLPAEKLLEQRLGRDIVFLNDADAAGVAEAHYGGAKDQPGLTILTTLGTGIGSAMLLDGVLIPNTELGHLELDGHDVESRSSAISRQRLGLSFDQWAKQLERYYRHLVRIFSPDLILVGGGVSKQSEDFLPLIDAGVPIRPASLRNNAGIIGAAFLAHSTRQSRS